MIKIFVNRKNHFNAYKYKWIYPYFAWRVSCRIYYRTSKSLFIQQRVYNDYDTSVRDMRCNTVNDQVQLVDI